MTKLNFVYCCFFKQIFFQTNKIFTFFTGNQVFLYLDNVGVVSALTSLAVD